MFNTNLDKILANFTKLYGQLDRHISNVQEKDELLAVSEIGIAKARAEFRTEIERAERIKKNVAKLID